MVVIEDKNPTVILVATAADAGIARTEVTILDIFRKSGLQAGRTTESLAMPGAILSVGGNNDPLLSQRMPPFFPVDSAAHWSRSSTQDVVRWSGMVRAPRSLGKLCFVRYDPTPTTFAGCSIRSRARGVKA